MISNAIETVRLLVVSRDSAVLRPLWSLVESNHWQLETAVNAWEAIDRVQSGVTLNLLLLDLPHGDTDGFYILRWLRRLRPVLPIIMIGQPDDNGRKQELIRMGARDYLMRPLEESQLEMVIQRNLSMACEAAETDITSDDVEPVSKECFFIGISPIMRKLRDQAALLAEASVPVLIIGEDGSGKETIARLIHRLSVASEFEFAKVSCTALPGDLLEKELFGYERNGTTAPVRTRTGKLEHCSKGMILLDEITEMPLGLQSNLLEVLQNKRFIRPGTSAFIEADVRVMATSARDVERAINENRLREDLYHQLNAYTIHVPPLRDRKEELPFLSLHFMRRLARHYGLSPREFSPAIIESWQEYNWPGNLRELECCVKRYLMVGDEDLAFGKNRSNPESEAHVVAINRAQSVNQVIPSPAQPGVNVSTSKSLRSLVQNVKREAEKNAISAALERTGWNRKAASRLLKVSYRAMLYKIDEYKLTPSNSLLFLGGNGSRNKAIGLSGNSKAGLARSEGQLS